MKGVDMSTYYDLLLQQRGTKGDIYLPKSIRGGKAKSKY